jgi:hypothetical protein
MPQASRRCFIDLVFRARHPTRNADAGAPARRRIRLRDAREHRSRDSISAERLTASDARRPRDRNVGDPRIDRLTHQPAVLMSRKVFADRQQRRRQSAVAMLSSEERAPCSMRRLGRSTSCPIVWGRCMSHRRAFVSKPCRFDSLFSARLNPTVSVDFSRSPKIVRF